MEHGQGYHRMGNARMDAEYQVRVASTADIEAIESVLADSYCALFPQTYSDDTLQAALPLITRANRTLIESGNYYVAELTDVEIVGCGGWSHERPGTKQTEPKLAHVRHFAIRPHCIRRGIGRAIFQRIARDTSLAGIHTLECYASLNSVPFYSALGFQFERLIEVELGHGVLMPGVVMRHELSALPTGVMSR